MAVVVSLYGKADLKQIERAEKQLRDLKREVGSQGGAWSKFNANLDGTGRKMQSFGTTMSMGVTLPVVGALGLMGKAAVEEEAAMAQLEKALKNNAGATSKQVGVVEEWITKTQNATGILDDELRPGLANLVRSTKDVGKAQELMGIAMDISVAKGKPLETVTAALAKAYQGNTGALGRLGIATKDTSGKTLDLDQVMKNAVETYGGSAQRAADTTAGKLGIMQGKFADLSETIGNDLIPLATDAMGVISPMIDKLASMPDWLRKLLLGVGIGAAAAGPLIAGAGTVLRGVSSIKGFVGGMKGGGGTAGVDKLGTSSSVAATEVATLGRAAATASGKTAVAGSGLGTLGGKAKTAGGQIGGAGSKAQTLVQPLHNLTGATKTASPQVRGLGKLAGTGSTKLGKFSGALGSSSAGAIAGVMGLEVALAYTIPKVMQAGDAFMQWMDSLETLNANRQSKKDTAKAFRANVIDDYGSVDAYLAHLAQKFGKDSTQYQNALYALGINSGTYNPASRWGGKQAKGGDYWVTRPTLFLAGEAGPERATFTPQGKAAPGTREVHLHVHVEGGTFIGTDLRRAGEELAEATYPRIRQKLISEQASGF